MHSNLHQLSRKLTALLLLFAPIIAAKAQEQGVLSGNLQSNFSIFELDSTIGAYESPQYLSEKSSAESWLFLNYQIKDFNFSARYDLFNNSNLLNPTGTFSGHGIGFWQIQKKIDKLDITVGSFYDQFGSGLVFRAFENRLIGIDYAVEGVRAQYNFTDDFFVKAFTGRQKGSQENRFESSPEIIKGINTEKFFRSKNGNWNLNLGGAYVNRTIDNTTMSLISTEINSYPIEERFIPKWNVYTYSGYANLSWKNFNLYAEYAGKTPEAIRNPYNTKLELHPGNVIYGGLNYSKAKLGKSKKGGIGINLQYRRIDKYQFKISPNEQIINGILTYQPSLTRQASFRLLARYNAPAQDYGEEGFQAEVNWKINKKHQIGLNFSNITRLFDGTQLFREYYADYSYNHSYKLKGKVGISAITYNQEIYEFKPGYPVVHTLTPFYEVTYRINRRNSLRWETQYLRTQQDLGSFINSVLELNMSPHYSFSISDMVNVEPVRFPGSIVSDEIVHYYTLFGKYTINTTAFTLGYIKQVEGVNCTGGICRLEPAFSGFRFTVVTNF